jgi:uncharacterized protein
MTIETNVRALVLVGGHSFDAPSFEEMLASLDGVSCRIVAHPEALDCCSPEGVGDADVLVLYDMPGLYAQRGHEPRTLDAPAHVIAGWGALLEAGFPVVILHHAIASWPAWDGFAEIVGGRFHYLPGTLRDRAWPDSGYRLDVAQVLSVVTPEHPVVAGLPAEFELVDETYCCAVFEDEVTPLLVSDAPTSAAVHHSTLDAVRGPSSDGRPWTHPDGSPLAAWTRLVGRSTIVYLQPGDGPSAFTNPHYRRLLTNAVVWAASTRP